MRLRFLNSFILIGIILLFISVAGLVSGNTLLTEPGQPVNRLAWLEYLGAAVLMLINGAVSIWNLKQSESARPPARERVEGLPEAVEPPREAL